MKDVEHRSRQYDDAVDSVPYRYHPEIERRRRYDLRIRIEDPRDRSGRARAPDVRPHRQVQDVQLVHHLPGHQVADDLAPALDRLIEHAEAHDKVLLLENEPVCNIGRFDELAAALDAHCLAEIARFKRPKSYYPLSDLPKNNYGKILKLTTIEAFAAALYILDDVDTAKKILNIY